MDARQQLRELVAGDLTARGLGTLLRWCPHVPHPRQVDLLLATEPEIGYGGAGGGGKSDGLLMWLIAPVDVPGYSGIAFRRTYTDLALSGALMDRAHQWLSGTGARWVDREKRWTFPAASGQPSSLSFAYLETDGDRYRYKSAEFQRCAFDEVTQFPTPLGPRYLHSRLRRLLGSTLPIQLAMATNPGDVGHQWVKEHYGLSDSGEQAASWTWRDPLDPGAPARTVTRAERRWIRATLDDNPSIDAEAYDASLARLDSTTYAQLRRGLWIVDGSSLVFRYDDARNGVDALPERRDWRYALGVDVGTSDSSPTTAFVRVAWCSEDRTVWVARAWRESGLDDDDIADRIEQEHETYGEAFHGAVIDTGGLGKTYLREARKRAGLAARAAEKSDKPGTRKLLNGDLEKGLVRVVRGQCADLVRELHTLVWNEARTDVRPGLADHCADALLYVWREATAYASQAPTPQPAPGTREALEAEARAIREREKERYRDRQRRAPGEGW